MPNCVYHSQPERLRRLIDDGLPDSEQAELAAHLETCPECCQRLDAMAAKSGYWSELRLLKDRVEFDRPPTVQGDGFGRNDRERERDHEDVPLGLLEPPAEPDHLGRLGPYDVLSVVGRGGMGIVFQARDRALDRLVAIKILTPGLASTAAARRRFAREAKAAAAVVNEHVVAIHAVDTTPQGVPYLVMQYVAGKSVQDLIDQGEPPQLRQVLRIGMQAAQALAAAHAQGLIHRDVKPANILLENGIERVKITDFGLARAVDDATMTQSGVVAGTPRYMAPEQARGDAIDHRADLFSLGSVLYALCTGRAPFLGSSSVATLKRVCEETPTPVSTLNPDIPDWLVRIIARLHAKDASDRYKSATEVADLLGRCLAHVQQPTTVPLPPELAERPVRRRSVARWAIAACVLVGTLGALAGGTAVGEQVVDYVATVLRLKTPEGTLVIETDDPNLSIKVDGNDLVVTGAGVKELRLPVGPHNVQAAKDGTTLRDELVTITRGGKKRLSVSREREAQAAGGAGVRRAVTEIFDKPEKAPLKDPVLLARRAVQKAIASFPERQKGKAASTAADLIIPAPLAVLRGHGSEVRSVAFSPDSKTLASGSQTGAIRLWEITPAGMASELCKVLAHENGVESVAFSPDGKTLASGGWDHHVKLWDLRRGAFSGEPLWTWEGTSEGGRPVAFSPDGEKLLTGSFDGFLTILHVATGQQIRSSSEPARPVNGVRLSPDGQLLALALGDCSERTPADPKGQAGEVQVWDWPSRKIRAKLTGWTGECKSVAFSPDGTILAATSGDGTIRVYDVKTFREKAVLGSGPFTAGLDFRPDGKLMATSNCDGNVWLWDPATTGLRATFRAHQQNISALAFSPDGRVLATASADGSIKLWDVSEPSVRQD
jgi:eukaryotic-like serine/threonine-protein kinase